MYLRRSWSLWSNQSYFDNMKVSSLGPYMFSRYYVVYRKFPAGSQGEIRDICGFFLLGLGNKFLFSAVLCGSKDFARKFEEWTCKRKDGIPISSGFILLMLLIPSVLLKIFSGGVPPFLTGRMTAAILLSFFGLVTIIAARGSILLFVGIALISYGYALRETTYSQYNAFFVKRSVKSWVYGCLLSNFCGGMSYLFLKKHNMVGMVFILIAPHILEIFAYCLILTSPVDIDVLVIDRVADTHLVHVNTEFWQPVSVRVQYQNFQRFWKIISCYIFIISMSLFNLQGTLENLSSKNIAEGETHVIFYNVCLFGSILGTAVGGILQTRHIWIVLILEIGTTVTLAVEVFYQFIPYNGLISLMLFEGSLLPFAYLGLFSYLSKKIDHKYPAVVAFNMISLMESCFGILAGVSILIFHKIVCMEKNY